MKKKISLIILIVLLIIVSLLIANFIRNYNIIKNITEYSSSMNDNISNYYLKINNSSSNDDNSKFTNEYYYKDKILLQKTTFMGENSSIWYNFNTGEIENIKNDTINTDETSNNNISKAYNQNIDIYKNVLFSHNIKDIILNYALKPISLKDNCYKIVIKDSNTTNEYYINKDSKLIEKLIIKNENETTENDYELKLNCVTDEDVKKPI